MTENIEEYCKKKALKFYEYHSRFRKEEGYRYKRECDRIGGAFMLADYGIGNIYDDFINRKPIKCEWCDVEPMEYVLDENDDLQLVPIK